MNRHQSSANTANLLLRNARIRSGPDFSRVSIGAVAIRGAKIVAVGPDAAATAGPDAHVVDVDGALVLPGFVDAHTHLGWAGEGLWRVNWRDDVRDRATTLDRVRIALGRMEPGFWLLGGDWSRAVLPDVDLPSLAELDHVTGSTPMFLRCDDASLALVNSSAMRLMQLPNGIQADGRLTGVAANARATAGVIPPPDRYRRRAELRTALRELARHGITEAHDIAALPSDSPTPLVHRERSFTDASLFEDLATCGQLTARIGYRQHVARWQHAAPDGLIACLGVKELIDDGRYSAPGLDFGYEFRYAGREATLECMRVADSAGLDITLHALGDLAVTEALDLFEALARSESARARRPRIAHARRIAASDIPRLARLGITVEAQPWDALIGMPRLAAAGDEAFIATCSPFRDLLDAGANLVFSSDWRISPQRPDGMDMDPLVGMYCAVTRQLPVGGAEWRPEQRITVGEALAAYTTSAATLTGASRGVLAPGMDADLVVLSRDIVANDPSVLLETRVLTTIVNGRVVFGDGGDDGN